MKQNNKTHILFRYGLITIFFLLFAAAVIVKLFDTTVVDANAWNQRAKNELSKIDTIAPERGNILASNGNILACNLQVYDIKLDLRHKKVQEDKSVPWDTIAMLADSLDKYYPRTSNLHADRQTYEKYTWHNKLKQEFDKQPDKRTRALRIARNKTLEDFDIIHNFPYLNKFSGRGFRNPLYKEEKKIRMYPFGRMAYRSIGRVNEDSVSGEVHGYSGLERDLDSLLYGQPGEAKKVALTNGITNWVSKAPKRGYDIHTTIDVDLQDMLEEQLLNVCTESRAEWGTAILMEVATGEIKAISNIQRLDDGSYGEALNRAVLPFEPGSVMKPISLMIAFEDKLVNSVNDLVDCSPFQRTSDHAGGGMKNMKQVIETSSNTGIARVIFRGYAKDPAKFYDRLASIGFFEPMHTGIAGECTPRIRRLVDHDSKGNNITMTARHLDLARQAYGYNTEIPPIYTLSIYNAIANKGRYVRPHLVRGLIDETGKDSILPITYIRDRICSEANAEKVKQCIKEVVWGNHGTAQKVRDDRVMVVGKTGTAYPVVKGAYDTSKRRYAFAGFFPYEEPKYSCMALVLGPAGTSANRTSGQVVKNMALKMYARGMLDNVSTYAREAVPSTPLMTGSTSVESSKVANAVNSRHIKKIKVSSHNERNKVPDVKGYDVTSAVRIMESHGLNVLIHGSGKVVAQSIPPGNPIEHGSKITLTLRP